MKNKEVWSKVLFQGLNIISFSILFFLFLRLPMNKVFPIYTYRGIILLCLTSILLLIVQVIYVKKKIKQIDVKDATITILLFVLVHMLVFGMVAVTIERAYSVFLLSEISKSEEQKITCEQAKDLFMDKYIGSNGAIQKRLDEQMATGTIKVVSEDTYQMTDKGNFIVKLFKIFDFFYSIKSDLL